jgi:ribosomal protein S27E
MGILSQVVIGLLCGAFFFGVGQVWRYITNLRQQVELSKQNVEASERAGHFVQVDCRECGKLNRIPSDRLRNRPICGGCKSRLLPKRKITLCHIRNLEFDRALSKELDGVITDYDKFWPTLDAHFKRNGVKKVVLDAKDLPN